MRTTVKTFLVFVLLMVTYSLSSRAVNFTGMVDKAASTCEVSASSSSLKNASSDNVANNTRSLFTNSKFMWTTDAELGNNLSLKDILLIPIVFAELLKLHLL